MTYSIKQVTNPITGLNGIEVSDSQGVFARNYHLDDNNVTASSVQILRHSDDLTEDAADSLAESIRRYGMHGSYTLAAAVERMALRNAGKPTPGYGTPSYPNVPHNLDLSRF